MCVAVGVLRQGSVKKAKQGEAVARSAGASARAIDISKEQDGRERAAADAPPAKKQHNPVSVAAPEALLPGSGVAGMHEEPDTHNPERAGRRPHGGARGGRHARRPGIRAGHRRRAIMHGLALQVPPGQQGLWRCWHTMLGVKIMPACPQG